MDRRMHFIGTRPPFNEHPVYIPEDSTTMVSWARDYKSFHVRKPIYRSLCSCLMPSHFSPYAKQKGPQTPHHPEACSIVARVSQTHHRGIIAPPQAHSGGSALLGLWRRLELFESITRNGFHSVDPEILDIEHGKMNTDAWPHDQSKLPILSHISTIGFQYSKGIAASRVVSCHLAHFVVSSMSKRS